jgi:non-specific serine/threonine protein kinase/serine/threonine-protein kinase
MKPERWQQVKQVLDAALAVEIDERVSYLDKACAADSELRQEVESLLLHHQQAGTAFLNTPAVSLQTQPVSVLTRIGRRVGAYQMAEQIGHGGMGEVYRAARADGQYSKEVAIKLVRGGFDSTFILERFRNERQILATLDHPNIARLLDGGTTEDGVPYLVMELIEGTPIDQYCDEHRLSTTQRLHLFRQVCSAVQYAHQRLVIHRDLKPSNILVTEDGIPKLLDFGIAKILDPAGAAETTLARPMTPQYASPEQIRGETITTATDVYSLGVVLYELLTGRSPYGGETVTGHRLAQAICEAQPARPSTAIARMVESRHDGQLVRLTPEMISGSRDGSPARLRRRLSGDLDSIALKTLRKEPNLRYASAEQLAEDIRRHLDGLPVTASKGSWKYLAGKFALRHRVSVAATAVVVAAVTGGVIATLREARIAAANAQRAERRFNDVRKLANSLMFEIHDAIRDLPGSTPARRLLVTRALEYLDSLSAQAKGDVSLQKELATAYERVGDVLGYPYAANLGDRPGALQSYRKALTIRESLAATDPNDPQLQRDLVGNYFRVAQVLESAGDFKQALDAARKTLPITQRMAAGNSDPTRADQLAGSYYFIAGLLIQTGDLDGALENHQRGASIRQAALDANPGNMFLRTHLAADYAGIAKLQEQQADLVHAVQTQAKAIAILTDVSKANPDNAMLREYLGEAIDRIGLFRGEQGNAAAALEAYRESHRIFQDLLAADPKNSLAKSNFAFSDAGIARSLVAVGKPAMAIGVFREAAATFEAMSPTTTNDHYIRSGLAEVYSGLGSAYSALASSASTPPPRKREYWQEARSACQSSLTWWNEKEKLGELESGERPDVQQVVQCIAKCDSQLGVSKLGKQ